MALKSSWLAITTLLWLAACAPIEPPRPIDPARPSDTVAPLTLAPTRTPVPVDTGWREVQAGLEYRELNVAQDTRYDRLRMARVDPAQVRLRVRYDPDRPRLVSEWLNAPATQLAVNGNYFDPQHRALGLIVADGQRAGQAYQGFGGMFVAHADRAEVRWNVDQPFEEAVVLTDAMQNFPMLVLPGGRANDQIDDNGARAPRTAVAQDRSGRIVFVVSPLPAFTLTEFGEWLAASDLDVDAALNLDGGTSSGLLVRDGDQVLGVNSWVSVPSVIVAEAK